MKTISSLKNVSLIASFLFVWVYNNNCVWFNLFYLDVKELVQDCVGGAALQQCKAKIQAYGDQTSSTLKKHVYANYMQFIETAKEISRMIETQFPNEKLIILIFSLKIVSFSPQTWNQRCTNCRIFWLNNEIFYQRCVTKIQRMIQRVCSMNQPVVNEKRKFLFCLEYSFQSICVSETVDKDEIQNKKALAAIQESVIGFTGSLENKTFLHEGALIELDPEDYRPICRVYFFLLNDLLIVGKVKHDK